MDRLESSLFQTSRLAPCPDGDEILYGNCCQMVLDMVYVLFKNGTLFT